VLEARAGWHLCSIHHILARPCLRTGIGCGSNMRAENEKELTQLKERFDRGERSFGLPITAWVIGLAIFALLTLDPFDWFAGTAATGPARQTIRMGCFMIALCLVFAWFLLVRPLQTGIAVDFRKYGKSVAVLRSESPARFWGIFWYGVLLLSAVLALGIYVVVGGIREFKKSKSPPNSAASGNGAVAVRCSLQRLRSREKIDS